MQCLSVGTARYHGDLRGVIIGAVELLKHHGFGVDLEETKKGDYTFWEINLPERPQSNFISEHLAQTLAKGVIQVWEEDFLKQILRHNYYYFTPEERQRILTIARDILSNINRESFLSQEFLNYLESNSRLNLEGFLRFRAQEYWHDLEETVDDAVDDYILEKEYQEFIKLLQYFVEIQEPKVARAHVVISPEGDFKLYDAAYQLLDNKFFEGLIIELVDTDLTHEDLLISTLINVAPLEIIVHSSNLKGQEGTINTIKRIFPERVEVCSGCKLCDERHGKD